jgi:methyl-accepting chemotaxis protein
MFERMTVRARLAAGFGALLAVLVLVTAIAVVKVQTIKTALHANSTEHALIQRYAINFRGSAHDRAIAVRDVALSTSAD